MTIEWNGETLEFIGQGANRKVYGGDGFVVKINRKGNENIKEWENWLKIKGTEWEKCFCPCLEYNTHLVMLRAEEISDVGWFYVPSWLDDCKRENFGILDGRMVCLDYSSKPPPKDAKLKKIKLR